MNSTPPAGTPGWVVVALVMLAALGGVGGIVTLVNLPKVRRRMDVDSAKVLSDAAVELVQPLNERVSMLQHRVDLLEADKVRHTAVLREHALWDELAYTLANQEGLELPKPPPLFPPVEHPLP